MNLQTILVPLDFSDVSSRVVDYAVSMAKSFGGRVVLLHVAEPEPDFVGFDAGPQVVRAVTALDIRTEHRQLEEYKHRLAESGVEVTAMHIQGPLTDKVLQQAEEHHADLIVMGSHGHGALYHLLVGSVTAGVVRGAKCPVLVVPAVAGNA
ncbi:MAG TPA: universal stress protein [Chthoniobacteraceae bacterium]|jgi:nucleotide-binding universal stress UspA family protein|nr:universal stress protein [Chthoniobacteraceae bacterium]